MSQPLSPFQITFSQGRTAKAVVVGLVGDLPAALDALGLVPPRPIVVVVGGAGGMAPREIERLRPLFTEVLAPTIAALGGGVVDGGTATGVMALMGEARADTGASFPLVGVAAAGTVTVPGDGAVPSAARLEPHHSHFVLVPGNSWGDEVRWIAGVASALAADGPSVTLVVNGGKITYDDVAASMHANRPVLAIHGSGGTADALAAALDGAHANARVKEFVASGLLLALDPANQPDALPRLLRQFLGGATYPS